MTAARRGLRPGPILLVLAVLAVVGMLVARKLRPLPVTVTRAARGLAVEAVYATGSVEAEERARVKAKVGGSLAELRVKEGQRVKKGEVLAVIDNPTAGIELRRSKGDLRAAQASRGPQLGALRSQATALEEEILLARRELERAERLATQGVVVGAELDRARTRVRQAEAQLAANRSQQRALRVELDAGAQRREAEVDALAARLADTEVLAPLDGVVLTCTVEPGEVVAPQQVLFTVGEVSRLILEVAVDEADVARISDGTLGKPPSRAAVSLYAFPGRTFDATVVEVLPDANRERKSFLTKLRLTAPPPELRSGMSAEVNVIVAQKAGALLVPSSAISAGAVWVVREGRTQRQPVTVGVHDLLRSEVLDGLAEGEPVVVEALDAQQEGARVVTTDRPMQIDDAAPDNSTPGKTSL